MMPKVPAQQRKQTLPTTPSVIRIHIGARERRLGWEAYWDMAASIPAARSRRRGRG